MGTCHHSCEVSSTSDEHLVTVHVCALEADHKRRHRCRKPGCGFVWWAHDHDPFDREDQR